MLLARDTSLQPLRLILVLYLSAELVDSVMDHQIARVDFTSHHDVLYLTNLATVSKRCCFISYSVCACVCARNCVYVCAFIFFLILN